MVEEGGRVRVRDGNTCTVLSEEKGEGKKGERTKDQ